MSMEAMKPLTKKMISSTLAGIVAGVLLLILLRAAMYKSPVHYHANFGVFIHGEREQFESFSYYEEVEACSLDSTANPKAAIHLHQPDNDVIHVHQAGMTWAALFTNLGLSLSNSVVETEKGVFVDGDDGKKLTFILNGTATKNLANQVVQSEDVLLISYGGDPTQAQGEYSQIARNASEYNAKPDPSTCSGSAEESLVERIKQSVFGGTVLD